MNIFEDTCSTCKSWMCLTRKSQIAACANDDPESGIWMDKGDTCGGWKTMEEAEPESEPEPEPEVIPTAYPAWDTFYQP